MKQILLFAIMLFTIISCKKQVIFNSETISRAVENGKQANEGFSRSLKFVDGWLTKTDSASGLIPTNLTSAKDVWEPHNSAA
ncbi:MAG TPA: hypothetical protein PLC80_11500, partial [Draconibacterium sp.]|nr:hypothetical protein [Draconibacterium sp.]